MTKKRKRKRKFKMFEFSKLIIIQESVLVWISTIKLLSFAEHSIVNGYLGSLPYISTLCGAIWAAYGVSVGFYYNKAKAENLSKPAVGIDVDEVIAKMGDLTDGEGVG